MWNKTARSSLITELNFSLYLTGWEPREGSLGVVDGMEPTPKYLTRNSHHLHGALWDSSSPGQSISGECDVIREFLWESLAVTKL